LWAVSAGPFYQQFVTLPTEETPLSSSIRNNPKFYPFFENVIGAIDGTHINAHTSALERHINRDRKGGMTQNCLFGCDMDFRFVYGITGFEGSAADSSIYHHAHLMDFAIPQGKCYLADAGCPACNALLVPYHGVCYHLAEWGQAGIQYLLGYSVASTCINPTPQAFQQRRTIQPSTCPAVQHCGKNLWRYEKTMEYSRSSTRV
jgi:hypothetical protein